MKEYRLVTSCVMNCKLCQSYRGLVNHRCVFIKMNLWCVDIS